MKRTIFVEAEAEAAPGNIGATRHARAKTASPNASLALLLGTHTVGRHATGVNRKR
jgi:hypothetical protein